MSTAAAIVAIAAISSSGTKLRLVALYRSKRNAINHMPVFFFFTVQKMEP
jgi:hypothetical protein